MTDTKLNGVAPKRVVMMDLDGCVADDRWRQNKLPHNGGSWDEYHDGCDRDVVLGHGGAVLRSHIEAGHTIIFTTGRPAKVGKKSGDWITEHFGISKDDFAILMRPDADHRRAVDLKAEFADFVLGHKHDIVAAYDDRSDIVEMYRSKGINACVLDHKGLQIWQPDERPPVVTSEQREIVQGDPKAQAQAEVPVEHQKFDDVPVVRSNPRKPDASDIMSLILPNGANLTGSNAHRTYILFVSAINGLLEFAHAGMSDGDGLVRAATSIAALGEHIGEMQAKQASQS